MAMRPKRFERRILVEYRGMPEEKGRSPFREAVGRVFTDSIYKQADRLSVTNKEVILNLLRKAPISCALLPKEAAGGDRGGPSDCPAGGQGAGVDRF